MAAAMTRSSARGRPPRAWDGGGGMSGAIITQSASGRTHETGLRLASAPEGGGIRRRTVSQKVAGGSRVSGVVRVSGVGGGGSNWPALCQCAVRRTTQSAAEMVGGVRLSLLGGWQGVLIVAPGAAGAGTAQAGGIRRLNVVAADGSDREACLAIARASPEYFDAGGLAAMAADLGRAECLVAREGASVVGFAVVGVKGPAVADLLWIAVAPERRDQGVGTALLTDVVERLRRRGVRLLMVKTLAPTADYAPYSATRRFYERMGFLLVETIDPYAGWSPGNPCAVYSSRCEKVRRFRAASGG